VLEIDESLKAEKDGVEVESNHPNTTQNIT
jgi:hypothetical protein